MASADSVGSAVAAGVGVVAVGPGAGVLVGVPPTSPTLPTSVRPTFAATGSALTGWPANASARTRSHIVPAVDDVWPSGSANARGGSWPSHPTTDSSGT